MRLRFPADGAVDRVEKNTEGKVLLQRALPKEAAWLPGTALDEVKHSSARIVAAHGEEKPWSVFGAAHAAWMEEALQVGS